MPAWEVHARSRPSPRTRTRRYLELWVGGPAAAEKPPHMATPPHKDPGGAPRARVAACSADVLPLYVGLAAMTSTTAVETFQWAGGDYVLATVDLEVAGEPAGGTPRHTPGGGTQPALFTAGTPGASGEGTSLADTLNIPVGYVVKGCSAGRGAASQTSSSSSDLGTMRVNSAYVNEDGDFEALLTFTSVDAAWAAPTVPEAMLARCAELRCANTRACAACTAAPKPPDV